MQQAEESTKSPPKKLYGFHAEPELIDRIDRIVEQTPSLEGSRARLIRQLLREYAENEGPTLEAVAS